MKKLLLLSLFLPVFISCKDSIETNLPEEVTFDYKAYLLKNNEGVISIRLEDFDYEKTPAKISQAFAIFDLPIYDFNAEIYGYVIGSELWDFKHDKIPIGQFNSTELIVNFRNEILYNSSLYSIEEMDEVFYLNFSSNRDNNHLISIIHHSKTNNEIVRTIFNKMINAYLKCMEELSIAKYKKPLRELHRDQLQKLKNEKQITLFFPAYE
ncbi:hypothetical protein [Nonlabens sp.]|uniref:hypothetical protein n=1 Tax=Nonlabens sp. TaxID=1888209 RepID=UPI003F69DB8B